MISHPLLVPTQVVVTAPTAPLAPTVQLHLHHAADTKVNSQPPKPAHLPQMDGPRITPATPHRADLVAQSYEPEILEALNNMQRQIFTGTSGRQVVLIPPNSNTSLQRIGTHIPLPRPIQVSFPTLPLSLPPLPPLAVPLPSIPYATVCKRDMFLKRFQTAIRAPPAARPTLDSSSLNAASRLPPDAPLLPVPHKPPIHISGRALSTNSQHSHSRAHAVAATTTTSTPAATHRGHSNKESKPQASGSNAAERTEKKPGEARRPEINRRMETPAWLSHMPPPLLIPATPNFSSSCTASSPHDGSLPLLPCPCLLHRLLSLCSASRLSLLPALLLVCLQCLRPSLLRSLSAQPCYNRACTQGPNSLRGQPTQQATHRSESSRPQRRTTANTRSNFDLLLYSHFDNQTFAAFALMLHTLC